MRWRRMLWVVFAVSALLALFWRGSQGLRLSRTVIAKVPSSVNGLIETDLEGDGDPELLAIVTHPYTATQRGWVAGRQTPPYSRVASDRPWLIRSPLTTPVAEPLPLAQLPNSIGFPSSPSWAQGWQGDFDGDGLADKVVVKGRWGKSPTLIVYWGDGATPLSLPLSPTNRRGEMLGSDLDGDRRDELIMVVASSTLWVWRIDKGARRIEKVAALSLTPPNHFLAPPHHSIGALLTSPLLSSPPPLPRWLIVGDFWKADLDGDERQELLLFWREAGFLTCGLGAAEMPPPLTLAVQVVWWDGQKLCSQTFPVNKLTKLSHPPMLLTLKGQRYVLFPCLQRRRLFRPHLLSLRPLRWLWWETESEDESHLYRLPEGERGREVTAWQKVAELPGTPRLVGDWDEDGRLELLLCQTRTHHSNWSWFTSHDFLCLAQFDGHKIRYARWTYPRPLGSVWMRAVGSVVLKGHSGVALFVAWNAQGREESLIERIRWR
ncbi:MAG: hypothetical protein SLRJCFUN_000358 [Candidatus Fervidibacter sp.]